MEGEEERAGRAMVREDRGRGSGWAAEEWAEAAEGREAREAVPAPGEEQVRVPVAELEVLVPAAEGCGSLARAEVREAQG